MQKNITEQGPNGTYSAQLMVELNFRNQLKTSSQGEIWYHRLSAYIGVSLRMQKETPDIDEVPKLAAEMECKMREHLSREANKIPIKSVEEQLKDSGWK